MNKEIQAMYFFDNHAQFIASITRILNQLFSFCAKSFGQIEESDIQEWLNSMEEQGLPPYLVSNKLYAVQLFYQYCMEENMLKRIPSLFEKVNEPEELKSVSFGYPDLRTSDYKHYRSSEYYQNPNLHSPLGTCRKNGMPTINSKENTSMLKLVNLNQLPIVQMN